VNLAKPICLPGSTGWSPSATITSGYQAESANVCNVCQRIKPGTSYALYLVLDLIVDQYVR